MKRDLTVEYVFTIVGPMIFNGNTAMLGSNLSLSWFGSESNLHSCHNIVIIKEFKSTKIEVLKKLRLTFTYKRNIILF